MRSVAVRRPSSAPRWEGPRNGPRNRPQSPFLPLWDGFLLGACLPQTLLGDFILGGCYIAYMPFQILICYI